MRSVKLCAVTELPPPGSLGEFALEGRQLCVANDNGQFAVLDNACPHRQGPLSEGTLEEGKVLCPWHAWAFDLKTGEADHEPGEKVQVYLLELQGEDAVIQLES